MAEIVGGNGKIYYEYSVGDKATATKKRNTSRAIITDGTTDYTAENGTIYIQAGDLAGFGATDSDSTAFNFTFWDSTEGAVNLKDAAASAEPTSQKAELTVYFGIKMHTVGTPVVKISPFYWESITVNSVEKSASPKKYTDLDGHIELEEDLPDSFVIGASDKLMDRDAKVSGKIILEGTAHDDKLIYEINADIFGTPKLLARYSGGKLISQKTAYDAEGWYFEVINDKAGKNGHDVTWKLHIDTQVRGVAGLDKTVEVTATNFGKATYSTTGGTLVGIDGTTKYSTTLSYSDEKSNNPETDASTARGKTTWASVKASWAENSVFTDTAFKKAVQRREDENGSAVYYILDADGNEKVMNDADVVYRNSSRTAKYQMDIVPYIREVKTSLSEVNTGNPTVYSRTSLGHYPVYVTFAAGESAGDTATNYANRLREDISLEGFNLAGCSLNFENDDPNSLKVTDGPVGEFATVSLADNGKCRIPTGAGSGHVYVQKNIGTEAAPVYVTSLNNVNNDDAKGGSSKAPSDATVGDSDAYADYYNRQPNDTNNNRLTDDVYIDIWEFNRQAAKPVNNSALDIMMKINPANGMIGFAFCDGDLYWSMANNTYSYTQWANTADFIQCTGFAFDKTGESYGTALGGESGDTYADNYRFYVGSWGRGGDTRTGEANTIRIGSSICDDYSNMAKDRYKSPSIAADGKGNVYLAFFDLLNGEIRFQGGAKVDNEHQYGTLQDSYAGITADIGNVGQRTKRTLEGERNFLQVVATSTGISQGGKVAKAGQYVSIGVTQNTTTPVVVMVWFDGSNLMYSYNTTPNANRTGVNRTGWSIPVQLLSRAGKYCQLVMDNDDNIHVAAYDSAKGDLKYIFIDDYTNPADAIVCTVDSYGIVGKELTIDVAKTGDNQIPYIGYFGGKANKPRYAYLANPPSGGMTTWSASNLAGVDSKDKYTGVWECTIAPTLKVNADNSPDTVDKNVVTINDEYPRRINVGVWKAGAYGGYGQLAYSTTGDNHGQPRLGTILYTSSTNTAASNNGGGKCYGNGSRNGVLAYGVRYDSMHDYVETAQKR